MKKIGLLLVFVLGSMISLPAQENRKGAERKGAEHHWTEMVGVICNADNVTQADGKSACDESKGGKAANWVFIDDQGRATKIANPQDLKGEHGKMKVEEEMRKESNEEKMWIHNLKHISPGV